MKIDEDLIYGRYDKIRNELVIYLNTVMTQEERNDHGQNLLDIVLPFRAFISELKMEQEERNSKYYQENDDRIARLDDEYDFLNQERIKNFEL